MAFELYNTLELLSVIAVNPPQNEEFWLEGYDQEIQSESEVIIWDEVLPDYRLAPFVAPNVQGRVMREKGYRSKQIKPAYVKPKHVVEASRPLTRQAGEQPFVGTLSLEERYDAIVAKNIVDEAAMIRRRWAWMASKATIDASITIQGEDYPLVTVDFGRDASLTLTLAGTARWGQSAADPLANIQTMRTQAMALSGVPITRLIFGTAAWTAFCNDTKVLELLNTLRRGSDSNFNRTSLSTGASYEYQGQLSGPFGNGAVDLYTFSGFYHETDPDTGAITNVPYLDSGTVVGIGPGIQGVRLFGAIKDKRAGLKALSMFPKMWDQEDPSITYTMTQSAPLMLPRQPNNTFKIKAL